MMTARLIKSGLALLGILFSLFVPSFCFSKTLLQDSKEGSLENPTLSESTWIMPEVSVVMPSDLRLSSSGFEVAYGKQFPSLTQVGFLALTPLFHLGEFRILSSAKVGFSQKAGRFELKRPTGEILEGDVKLSWVPMSLGAKFIYTLADFPFIKPSLTFGGGTHWFYQSGSIPGVNQNFWVPYLFATPAISLLEGSAPIDWFGGFTFGVTFQRSLSDVQRVNSVSFDMGVNVLL
jgi:hypothetical protein